MFGRKPGGDAQAIVDAMSRSQAVIEFNIDGTIITANQNRKVRSHDCKSCRLPASLRRSLFF